MSGIEPEAFRMRNGRSTTELHPLDNLLTKTLYRKQKLGFSHKNEEIIDCFIKII